MQSKYVLFGLLIIFILSCQHAPESKVSENSALPTPTVAPNEQQTIADLINKSRIEKFSDTLSLDVYYVTNRNNNPSEPPCSNEKFGVQVSSEPSYGYCKVNVPKKHTTGQIESSLDARADSHTFFKIISEKKLDFEPFQKNLLAKNPKDVFVFIHGFNVKFQEAVFRAAQLAYDLKFQGPVVLFSWPAGAEAGFLNNTLISRTYDFNKKNAQASIAQALDFFDLVSRLELKTYVYVHSMGHQVVIPTLVQLSQNSDVKLLVNELILNAPDFDLKQFKEYAPSLLKLAQRITLYCSYNDTAIMASKTLNKGDRLGACENIDGIDVINVSEVDNPAFGMGLGHGYYSSRAVLTDVSQLMLGIEAEKRLFIRKSEPNSTEQYYLRP